ncbi:hypothetical protein K1F50_01550 [Muricauda oceani]|uniref:Lipocalin-like domain-containing protein n=1 Tax=Flagellimonas oceani TaxID=2698672 RepID=A0A6G7J1Q4_9FLAO|nr:hypothetical protein [Allomuricauda oceani]MBW8241466.1 hypothetical protein [Allomuricauda oceani]QII44538.1 hypothetical protein GVT53_07560 [Allomuricauda oceani]
MKKIILVLLTILIVVSCSKSDDGTDAGQTEATIVGKWYLVQKGSYENPIVYDYEAMEQDCLESGYFYQEPLFVIFTKEGDYAEGGGCAGSNDNRSYSLDGNTISYFNKPSGTFDISAEITELTSDGLIIEFYGGSYHEEYERP